MDVANDHAAAVPAPVPGKQRLRITVQVDDEPPAVFLMDRAKFTHRREMDDLDTPTGVEALIFEGRRLPAD